jgi:hypothetical protein
MKKLVLAVAAVMLISASASGQSATPPVTCDFTKEVKQLSAYQLQKIDAAIEKTKPFSPPREVLSAQAIGILQLLDQIDQWENKNCRVN